MGNQMATSEIRKYFHAHFVKILIISRAFMLTNYAYSRGFLIIYFFDKFRATCYHGNLLISHVKLKINAPKPRGKLLPLILC